MTDNAMDFSRSMAIATSGLRAQAGRMRQKGEMWVLYPRDQVPR